MKPTHTAIAALATLGSIAAQGQADTATQQLDPVVVTANKYAQKQSTTGKVITVITRQQIEAGEGRTLAQLLTEQAGLTVVGAFNSPGSPVTLFTRGANSGRTLLLLDGMPINDPSNITGEYDLNLFSLNDIEQIEVCRGAQSTLYGSDAIAGVVNLITQKQNAQKPLAARLTASYGTQNTHRLNGQVYGKIGKLSYQARLARLGTNGFSAAYDSTGTKGFDNDGFRGWNSQASATYQAAQQLSFKAFVQSGHYRTDADAAAFVDEKDFTLSSRSTHLGTGFIFKNDKVQVTGNFLYSRLVRHYSNDSLDIPGFTRFALNDYAAITRFAEVYASIPLGAGFTLLQGGDFRNASYNNQYQSRSSFGPFNSEFRDTGMSQASLYASLNYAHPKEHFFVELGGRLNVHSRFGNNTTYTLNPTYKFNPHFRVLASVATGFKSPSIFQLYDGFSGNRNLAPETSINYEGGLQYGKNRRNFRAVYFWRNIDNGIDYNYVSQRYFNFVNQRVQGLEIEASTPLYKGLSLAANYTYLDPEERTQNRATNKDTITYSYLLRRPRHSLNATLALAFKGLRLGLTGHYVSTRFDVGGFRRPDVELADYLIFNAHASYRFNPRFQAFADGQNLLGKRFFDLRGYNSIPLVVNAGVTVSL